ncbi:hypothetical protein V8F06_009844 [Rhypophila decipiens]
MAQVPVKPKTFEEVLSNISSAKWTFGSEPNPWYDVDNLVPRSPDAIVPFHLFGNFPPEIILYMVQFLPKESAISLALTNKGMLQLIGERVFDGLTDEERWRLVLLLERDSVLMTACHCCQRLHNPISKGRISLGIPCDSYCTSGRTLTLNSGITSALCRLVARQYLRQQPYTDFLTLQRGTLAFSFPDFKIFQSTALKMVHGNLMLRVESFIAPFAALDTSEADLERSGLEGADPKSPLSKEKRPNIANTVSGRGAFLLHQLNRFGDCELYARPLCPNRSNLVPHGCRHQTMAYLGFSFPRNDYRNDDERIKYDDQTCGKVFRLVDEFATSHQSSHHSPSFQLRGMEEIPLGRRQEHPDRCYKSGIVATDVFRDALHPMMDCALYHTQPCVESSNCKALVGRVRSCPECFTDTCMSAQDVPGVGRVMTLTSWRDLGDVTSAAGLAAWFSHFNQDYDRMSRRHSRRSRTEDSEDDRAIEPRHAHAAAGSIHAAYEGIRGQPGPLPNEAHPRSGKRARIIHDGRGQVDCMESGYQYTAQINTDKRLLKLFMNPAAPADNGRYSLLFEGIPAI